MESHLCGPYKKKVSTKCAQSILHEPDVEWSKRQASPKDKLVFDSFMPLSCLATSKAGSTARNSAFSLTHVQSRVIRHQKLSSLYYHRVKNTLLHLK